MDEDKIIKKAIVEDENYADTWHCNIATACFDAIKYRYGAEISNDDSMIIGNNTASKFMKLCFNVETTR
jgi:hypothetical protein